ncbi:indolethylamine N-methyltransferase-like [Lissotriton helveticus]
MASGLTLKNLYEKYFDAESNISTYFMPNSEFRHDAFTERGNFFASIFSSGDVKGDILIKYGGTLLTSSLLPACESFKDIFIVDFLDSNLKHVDQWMKKELGTIVPSELEKKDREMWIEKEEKVRKAIKDVFKGELAESHPVAPALPAQADCILSEFCLEFMSTDKKGYCKALKSMTSLLKPGGCLIMSVVLECTFYMQGNAKFPAVSLDDEFVKKAVIDEGFDIKETQVAPRLINSLHSISDFSAKLFLFARKGKDKE